ncbi:MAG: STAS domain-containing protein [Verrucomicrobia bacterium]|nr:STAS domain-containing protein [Cytophagales bacterium]
MKYIVEKQEKYTLIKPEESKLDATVSAQFKAVLVEMNAEGQQNFIIDLSGVKYIDSSGLSTILVANRLCFDANGVLILCSVSEHVMKLIKISQLDSILEILPTLHEAVEAVFMNELEKDFNREEN